MCKPRVIEDTTVEDLKVHRWCFYQNDDEGFNTFEYIIPDSHPEFSEHIMELELSEFKFSSGKVFFGAYNGSETFSIIPDYEWYYFWNDVAEPAQEDLEIFNFLLKSMI